MQRLLVVLIIVLLAGCDDSTGSGGGNGERTGNGGEVLTESEERNAIEIRNLSPATVKAGETVTFVFDVAYSLADHPQGIINIGFNLWNPSSFAFVEDKAIVSEGQGVKRFEVTTTPVKWDEPLSFKLHVSLSEYPHASSWEPLATRVVDIAVAPASAEPRQRSGSHRPVALPDSLTAASCFDDAATGRFYCIEF